MKIAIIGGTGKLGLGIVNRLLQTAHEAALGSRDASKAVQAAAMGGGRIQAFSNVDAAAWCDAAIVTVPYSAHREILTPLKAGLRQKIVIDATVPLKPSGSLIRPVTDSGKSAAEEAQALLSESDVFAAFQTTSHRVLRHAGQVEDVLVTGNSQRKGDVMELIRDMHLRPIDAGPLEAAALVECITALLLSINKQNHVKESGLKVTGL